MDFDLSPDQSALREAAAALLEKEASVDALRARVGPGTVVGTLPGGAGVGGTAAGAAGGGRAAPTATEDTSAPEGFDRSLWASMAGQGWPAVERPEPDGPGWGMVEVAVLCEQVGRHVAAAPFAPTVLALDALSHGAAGQPALEELVTALAAGDTVGCVAWAPASAGAPGAVGVGPGGEMVVTEGPGGPTLTGTTGPVLYAPSASVAVVVVDDQVFALARPEGTSWSAPEPAMDRTRELGRLVLDGAPAWRLGGTEAVTRLVDRCATATAAELLGLADRALAMAVAYAKERVQFGKPIGSFQAVKHRLADALVDVEGMRSTAYYAAWCVAEGDPEASVAASMAKSWCADAARRVLASALQVHGGIGFTWEHELHWYLKRGQLDQVLYGDAGWHRDRLMVLLGERMAAGERIL